MYGAQTPVSMITGRLSFENDVEMYGAQTVSGKGCCLAKFENDVEMYGAQTEYDEYVGSS